MKLLQILAKCSQTGVKYQQNIPPFLYAGICYVRLPWSGSVVSILLLQGVEKIQFWENIIFWNVIRNTLSVVFRICIRAFHPNFGLCLAVWDFFPPGLHSAIEIVKSQCKVNLKNPIYSILLWEKSNKITYLDSYVWWNTNIMSSAGDELHLISVL